MRGYGARDISLLTKHVSQPRETYGCDPDECVNELRYVKNLVTKFRSSDTTVSFLDLWKQVLDYEDKHNMFLNMAGLIRIMLAVPVQTAELERGFSVMKRVKQTGEPG